MLHKSFCIACLVIWVPILSNASAIETTLSRQRESWMESDSRRSALVHFLRTKIAPTRNSHFTSTSPEREMEEIFSDEFQSLIKGLVLSLPDIEIEERVGFIFDFNLQLWLSEFICYDVFVDDIFLQYNKESNQRVVFDVDISIQNLICRMNFRYNYGGLIRSSGFLTLRSVDNSAKTRMAFTSPDFDLAPPNENSLEFCESTVGVSDLNFTGNIEAVLLNFIEQVVIEAVKLEIDGVVCEEFGTLVTDVLGDLLNETDHVLKPYLEPAEAWRLDPLYAEKQTTFPPEVVNFFNASSPLVGYLNETIKALSDTLDDPAGPTEEGRDLAVNIYLRNQVLQPDRSFVLSAEDWIALGLNQTVYHFHDHLTETLVLLSQVKFLGLDTLTEFDPLNELGNFTIRNLFKMASLRLEMDLVIEVKASSLSDEDDGDFFIGKDDYKGSVVENVTLSFGFDDIEVAFSGLMAIDTDLFGQLDLGSMMQFATSLNCFLESLYAKEISELSVSFQRLRPLHIDGFVSEALSDIISNVVEAVYIMYEKNLLRVVPSFFQTYIRDALNDGFKNSVCEESNWSDEYIDFRDFLLVPDRAVLTGGSDEAPYGQLTSSVFTFLSDQLSHVNVDGDLALNYIFIRPVTQEISGTEGRLSWEDDIFTYELMEEDLGDFDSILSGVLVRADNVRIENLDTFVPPFRILGPTDEPHVLSSFFNLEGSTDNPLTMLFTTRVSLNFTSYAPTENLLDVGVSFSSLRLLTEVFATVDALDFARFPLEDIYNIHCWLSLVSIPVDDGTENWLRNNASQGLIVRSLEAEITDLEVVIDCIQCDTAAEVVPKLIKLYTSLGVVKVLEELLPALFSDFATSPSLREPLYLYLEQAPKFCPHRPEYNETAEFENFTLPSIQTGTLAGSNAFLYSSIVAGSVGVVIFVESHSEIEYLETDPLSGQAALDVADNATIMDFFVDLYDPFGYYKMLLDSEEYLGTTQVDETTNEGDLGINQIVRAIDDDGVLNFVFQESFRIEVAPFILNVHALHFSGLDSFTVLRMMDIIAPQTIQTRFHLEYFEMMMEFSMDTLAEPQRIEFTFGLDNINASVSLLSAIDWDILRDIKVGSLLEYDSMMQCIPSAFHQLSFTQIFMTLGNILIPRIDGLEALTNEVVSAVFEGVVTTFRDDLIRDLPKMLDMTLKGFINDALSVAINEECEEVKKPKRTLHYVDLRDLLLTKERSVKLGGNGDEAYGDWIPVVMTSARDTITAVNEETQRLGVSFFLDPLTMSQSGELGTFHYPGENFRHSINASMGEVNITADLFIENTTFKNLDAVGVPMLLLNPLDGRPHHLQSQLEMGATDRPLHIKTVMRMSVRNKDSIDGYLMKNKFEISLYLFNASVVIETLSRIAEDRFFEFALHGSFDHYCLLSMMPAPPLDIYGLRSSGAQPSAGLDLNLSIEDIKMNITCIDCSSPGIEGLGQGLQSADDGVSRDITAVVNNILSWGVDVFTSTWLQNEIDRMLNDAPFLCKHGPQYDPQYTRNYEPLESEIYESSGSLILILGCLTVTIGFIILCIIQSIKMFVNYRHRNWLDSLPIDHIVFLSKKNKRDVRTEAWVNETTKSMFESTEIPVKVRYLIPFLVLVNIAFFLSGHLNTAADTRLIVEIAGESLVFKQLFKLSIIKSVQDMLDHGAEITASFIIIFSIIWPYTKQCITLASWFLPPERLSVYNRGSILLWMDTLAKWSMVDIFSMFLSLASFRIDIQNPELSFYPEKLYSASLFVIPVWGIYANIIAQIISQVSSHFIIHFHRKIVRIAVKNFEEQHPAEDSVGATTELEAEEEESKSIRLCDATFSRPHRGEERTLVVRTSLNYIIPYGAALIIALLIAGACLPGISVEIQGLVGLLAALPHKSDLITEYYSVFDITNILIRDGRRVDAVSLMVGNGFLGIFLAVTVVIMPLLQLGLLLVQWFAPLHDKDRKKLSLVIEILQAWQFGEVFIFAAFITSWQFGSTSGGLLKTECVDVQPIIDFLAHYGLLSPKTANCLRTDPAMHNGTYLLAVGSFLLSSFNFFVHKATMHYTWDKEVYWNWVAKWGFSEWMESRNIVKPEEIEELKAEIQPHPVLFSDQFRWILRRSPDSLPPFESFIAIFEDDAEPLGMGREKPSSLIAPPQASQNLSCP